MSATEAHANIAMNMFAGMPVYESVMAQTRTGGRVHQVKAWMHHCGCYHRRIEKKWAKRYGPVVYAPTAYVMKHPFGGQDVFVVHPDIAKKMREVAKCQLP